MICTHEDTQDGIQVLCRSLQPLTGQWNHPHNMTTPERIDYIMQRCSILTGSVSMTLLL
ncbi:hypothetical protein L2735_14115 [Shewanella olleyana]|uniref:hypothetical protein n=1 Tax=Shewanella olleyana TaxID=135626 RepID=UPI00200EF67A|nr:hypothetical protein [Shewanella olleyana]MCL1067926.1 hypothetical protein [Shewanella olleyana]